MSSDHGVHCKVDLPGSKCGDLFGAGAVELCAAAKNVMALAAGGVDGLRLGDNAKAGLISRGLREMARLGEACGARPETFAGLAGMGDLIVTCWSRHSRNRRAGELLARGFTPEAAAREIGMVVEGITAAPVLGELARAKGVEMPIVDAVGAVLRGTAPLSLVSSRKATASNWSRSTSFLIGKHCRSTKAPTFSPANCAWAITTTRISRPC